MLDKKVEKILEDQWYSRETIGMMIGDEPVKTWWQGERFKLHRVGWYDSWILEDSQTDTHCISRTRASLEAAFRRLEGWSLDSRISGYADSCRYG